MKIKRLLAIVMTVATLGAVAVAPAHADADTKTQAYYYDLFGNYGDSGKDGTGVWGFPEVAIKPTITREYVVLDSAKKLAKFGACSGKNIYFEDRASDPISPNETAMTWIGCKVEDDYQISADPDNKTPRITYNFTADKGKALAGLSIDWYGCLMQGGSNLYVFVTPEDPSAKKNPINYLNTYGYVDYVTGTGATQTGNYGGKNGAAPLNFNADEKIAKIAEENNGEIKSVYVTVVLDGGVVYNENNNYHGTCSGDVIRFTGISMTASQTASTTPDVEPEKEPETPATADFAVAAGALALVSGAALVIASRKKKED